MLPSPVTPTSQTANAATVKTLPAPTLPSAFTTTHPSLGTPDTKTTNPIGRRVLLLVVLVPLVERAVRGASAGRGVYLGARWG